MSFRAGAISMGVTQVARRAAELGGTGHIDLAAPAAQVTGR